MRIDSEWSKPFDKISAQRFILGRMSKVHKLLMSRQKMEDWLYIFNMFFYMEPEVLANLIKSDEAASESSKEDAVIQSLAEEGVFTIMMGLPGAGKTCSGVWLSEKLIDKGHSVYWFGYSPALAKAYPKIKQTFNLSEIENGVLFYDEVLLTMFGRNAATREVKERVLNFPYIRHHGMSVVMMSQTEQFDITLRNLLTYIWFKPFVITGMFERNMRFKPYVKYLVPQDKSSNLIYNLATNECMIFSNNIPNRWSDDVSKAMSPIKDPEEAKEYARMLQKAGISDRELFTFLSQRNVSPETVSTELNLLVCPKCKSVSLQRYGRYKNLQKWRCISCNHIFNAQNF